MKKSILMLLMLVAACVNAQNRSSNYITTTDYGDENASLSKARKTSVYFDGLGRQRQSISHNAGGDGEDIAIKTDYDGRGYKSVEWLPVPNTNGGFMSDNEYEAAADVFYGSGEYPFTLTQYDRFTLNQVSSVQSPGKLWQTHDISYENVTNDDSEEYSCQILKVEDDGTLVAGEIYANGSLRIKKMTDPDNLITLEFTDRNERVILKRQFSAEGSAVADTRFVYDRRGDLRYVVSPEGMALIKDCTGEVDKDVLLNFANSYTYDIWHRIIVKRIAGSEPIEYVYDKLNRPFMRQDGVQRGKNEWTMVKYDRWNRPVLEGIAVISSGRAALQDIYGDSLVIEYFEKNENSVENLLYYTNNSGPRRFEAYRAWYYDDYAFASDYKFDGIPGFVTQNSLSAKGLCTGVAMKIDGTVWFTATRYDHRQLPVWTCRYDIYLQNHRMTTCFDYDFRGNVVRRFEKVEDMSEQTVIGSREALWAYVYDAADRVKKATLSVNGAEPVTILENEYDAIGRLVSTTAGVRTEYGYDVQSNIISLNAPQFSQKLYFAQNPYSPEQVSYKGYVCAATEAYRDEELMEKYDYTYGYDFLGRLSSAVTVDGAVSEIIDYDLNANVMWLERKFGMEKVQDAVMEYDGNKIIGINDISTPYYTDVVPSFSAGSYQRTYDANGRLLTDGTRDITAITYHPWLNLPKSVSFGNGDFVQSSYLPDGTLMRRIFNSRIVNSVTRVDPVTGDTTVHNIVSSLSESHVFRGSFERIGTKWKLHTESGFYDIENKCHYFYVKNRLGSTVAVVDQNGKPSQLTAYYPSGVPYDLFGFGRATDKLHIGNRWMDHNGFYTYDNTARFHYPLIPTFDTPDPKAESYPSISPYAHCAGNPLLFVDLDGKKIKIMNNTALALMGFRNTVSPAEAGYVSIDENNMIVIKNGYDKNTSENFGYLLELVENENVVEFYTDFQYMTSAGINELDASWSNEASEAYLGSQEMQNEYGSFENFVKAMPDLENEYKRKGTFGICIYPDEGARGLSITGNNQIFVALQLTVGINLSDFVKTIAHEAYGHMLKKLRNEHHSHTDLDSEEGRNFESHINRVAEAAEQYYKMQNPIY